VERFGRIFDKIQSRIIFIEPDGCPFCLRDCTQRVVIIRERLRHRTFQSRIIARCISSVDFLHVSVHVCRTHVCPHVHLNTRLRGAIKPVIRRVPSERTRRRGTGEEDSKRAGRCYRRIGSQLGTYIHALNNSEAMISKLQITRRPTTKPAMGASSSLPRSLHFFFVFLYHLILSARSTSRVRFLLLLLLLLPRVRLLFLLLPPLVLAESLLAPFASVHQSSIRRNYNNNNDKSRNNVLCPREYREVEEDRDRDGKQQRGGRGLPPPAARESSFFFFILRLLLRHVSLYRFSLNRRYRAAIGQEYTKTALRGTTRRNAN